MDSHFFNYKMIIMYDGTPFSGWQMQPNGVSVQQKIQEAIFTVTKEKVDVVGSGRTDAGVHATGQTAHCKMAQKIDLYRIVHSINALLPPQICIKEMVPAPLSFHARHCALRKTYKYHVCLTPYQNPFRRPFAWHFKGDLDIGLLKRYAACFVGTHDFTSFANEGHKGSASKNPIRTLYRLDIEEQEEGLILTLEGDGFLYKMVRNIVGTMFKNASLNIPIEAIGHIFSSKDRKKAGPAAPAHGLCLYQVDY